MTIASDVPQVEKPSQEELERIKAFRLPEFVPPYACRRNKFADKAKAEANRWAQKCSLQEVYNSHEEVQAHYKSDIPELAMLGYVDCGEKEATWVTKYFIWVFMFDDHLDDIANFYSPEKCTSLFLELNVLLMWSFPDDDQFHQNFVEFLDEAEVADRSQALDYLHLKLDEARQNPGTGEYFWLSFWFCPESSASCLPRKFLSVC